MLELLSGSTALRDKLEANTRQFRAGMAAAGFTIPPGEHPIYARDVATWLAQDFADRLLGEGIYVDAFFYPVVPQGKAAHPRASFRPRTSLSRSVQALAAFTKVGRELGVI